MVRTLPADDADDRRARERNTTDRAKIGKLNVDTNNGTAARYNIRGIPTILLFKGGKVVDQKVGALPKSELTKMLDAHIG